MGQFDDRGKRQLPLHCNNFYFFRQGSMFCFTVLEGKSFKLWDILGFREISDLKSTNIFRELAGNTFIVNGTNIKIAVQCSRLKSNNKKFKVCWYQMPFISE